MLARALEVLKQDCSSLAAEQGFAKASAASLEAFGEKNVVTARTLAHLARVCASRGKKDIASSMYERILRIHEALPEPSNYDHAMVLLELAALRETSDDANRLRRKAEEIMKEIGSRRRENPQMIDQLSTGESGTESCYDSESSSCLDTQSEISDRIPEFPDDIDPQGR